MKKWLIFLLLVFSIIIGRIFYLNYYERDYYKKELENITTKYIYGSSAPRGRIIDRKGKVLVDNIGIKSIYYTKLNNINTKDEIEIAYELAKIVDIEINESTLREFYLLTNDNGDKLITDKEWEKYEKRELSSKDIKLMKLERITTEMLDSLTELDKKCATIYSLMNKGYSYQKKLIVKGISDEVYSKIIDKNIKGITTELIWERHYNYGDTLKDIFGSIGSISKDEKDKYLKLGYSLDDIVGVSYLELEYEDLLKGKKNLYKVNSDNTLTLIEEGQKGNDLYLSIDIDIQKKLENLLEENILTAKNYPNTSYFSEAYSIVGEPQTGEILAMSGRKLINKETKEFKNINTNLINTSYTVGSVVKMATVSTGYRYNVIDIGTSVNDSCVKLYNIPIKCSYKRLGNINDLTAIAKSSNYYQYLIAIGLTNNKYVYNMKLKTNEEDFSKFRDTFSYYGLGSLTGIDLPNETTGILKDNYSSDLLLNLSIGQYDTYTPIELFQYINTVASLGEKRKPSLMKSIGNKENTYEVVSKVPLDDIYLQRLREANHLALTSGTAYGYFDSSLNGGGKTGTSETFVDSNNDGKMDTGTTSIAFVGYAPYDNPKYSVVVMAPNIYEKKEYSYGKVYITRFISKEIMNYLFEQE